MSKEFTYIAWIGGVLAILLAAALFLSSNTISTKEIDTFSSVSELNQYLSQSSDGSNSLSMRSYAESGAAGAATPTVASDNANAKGGQTSYSTTNVQVEGVDEPDFVKTDGKYLYVLSNNNLSILEAYPAQNARIISTLSISGYYNQLFLNEDKLVVFGQEAYGAPCSACDSDSSAKIAYSFAPGYYNQQRSFIQVYDVSDPANPELVNEIKYDGSYYDARMVGSYVYAIVNQPISRTKDSVRLPSVVEKGEETKVAATDIRYFPGYYSNYQLTTIFAIDLSDQSINRDSFLTGYTQTLYASDKAIYLTAPKEVSYQSYQERSIDEVIIPSLKADAKDQAQKVVDSDLESYEKELRLQEIMYDYYNSLSSEEKTEFESTLSENMQAFEEDWQKETQKTTIHKIALDGNAIEYIGKAEVSGYLLNQFSLDEHEGYLRVATTTNQQFGGPIYYASALKGGDSVSSSDFSLDKNHVYVLNEDLDIVGKLENLAPGERIYSARFMGDRAYLVTFKQVDPLFVLDLSDPTNPEVLGKLKIPGYSTYLHPFDETHIIGIGQDTSGEVQEGSIMAAIPAGLKLALFDVSDPANPIEVDTYVIGAKGSESQALYDHKAFLFDAEKNLLVIPTTVREQSTSGDQWSWGKVVFQGAYVFELTKEDGFSLKGKITHLNQTEQSDMQNANENSYYYPAYEATIQRSFYIDNTLYTISQRQVSAHDLTTLEEQARVSLPSSIPQAYPLYADGGVAVREFAA